MPPKCELLESTGIYILEAVGTLRDLKGLLRAHRQIRMFPGTEGQEATGGSLGKSIFNFLLSSIMS